MRIKFRLDSFEARNLHAANIKLDKHLHAMGIDHKAKMKAISKDSLWKRFLNVFKK